MLQIGGYKPFNICMWTAPDHGSPSGNIKGSCLTIWYNAHFNSVNKASSQSDQALPAARTRHMPASTCFTHQVWLLRCYSTSIITALIVMHDHSVGESLTAHIATGTVHPRGRGTGGPVRAGGVLLPGRGGRLHTCQVLLPSRCHHWQPVGLCGELCGFPSAANAECLGTVPFCQSLLKLCPCAWIGGKAQAGSAAAHLV